MFEYFEYRVEQYQWDGTPIELQNFLEDFGKDYWELIFFEKPEIKSMNEMYNIFCVFKRKYKVQQGI